MVTLVERFSRHTLLAALPDSYDAANTAKAVTQALAWQSSHMVKTLTWDHRREMTRWADIEKNLKIKIYFCEPRSPWQQSHKRTNQHLSYAARYPNTPTSTSKNHT